MINTTILLTAMFILICLFLILIVLIPLKQEDNETQHELHDIEIQEDNGTEHEHEQDETTGTQDAITNKEYFNSDTSSVLPVKMIGMMYNDQQNSYTSEQELQSSKQSIQPSDYDILYNDSDNLSSRFQIPPPNTSANINAFVDFLSSTYNPINEKYRINSNGPLI